MRPQNAQHLHGRYEGTSREVNYLAMHLSTYVDYYSYLIITESALA